MHIPFFSFLKHLLIGHFIDTRPNKGEVNTKLLPKCSSLGKEGNQPVGTALLGTKGVMP